MIKHSFCSVLQDTTDRYFIWEDGKPLLWRLDGSKIPFLLCPFCGKEMLSPEPAYNKQNDDIKLNPLAPT